MADDKEREWKECCTKLPSHKPYPSVIWQCRTYGGDGTSSIVVLLAFITILVLLLIRIF